MPKAVTRSYVFLTPAERFALTVEALARGDKADADRLEQTCPKQTYSHSDAEFRDRLQRSYTITLLAMLNLQKLLAVIRCSNVFVEQHRVYADGPKLVAACALLHGRQYGLWEAGVIDRIEQPDPARIGAEVKDRPELGEHSTSCVNVRTRVCGKWRRRCRRRSASASTRCHSGRGSGGSAASTSGSSR